MMDPRSRCLVQVRAHKASHKSGTFLAHFHPRYFPHYGPCIRSIQNISVPAPLSHSKTFLSTDLKEDHNEQRSSRYPLPAHPVAPQASDDLWPCSTRPPRRPRHLPTNLRMVRQRHPPSLILGAIQ